MVYLVNLLLVPCYYCFIRLILHNRRWIHEVFFLIISLHAILFRALANPYVYPDTRGYTEAFQYICNWDFKEAVMSINYYSVWGQGYVALNWLICRFTEDPMYLFITLAILSVGGVMLYYKKTAYVPLLSVMLYLSYPMMYLMGFYVVRQHLAVVFILWALYFADNLKISIPLAVIAALCHTSAIVFLPYYFLKNIVLYRFTSIKLLVYSVVGFTILSSSVAYVLSFFSRYEEIYESGEGKNNIVPVILIGSLLLLYYITGVYKRVRLSQDMHIIRYLIYGLIIALFSMGTPGAGRLTLYFIYVIPVAICLPFKYVRPEMKTIPAMYLICLFFIVSYLIYIASDKYVVYKFLWEYV